MQEHRRFYPWADWTTEALHLCELWRYNRLRRSLSARYAGVAGAAATQRQYYAVICRFGTMPIGAIRISRGGRGVSTPGA